MSKSIREEFEDDYEAGYPYKRYYESAVKERIFKQYSELPPTIPDFKKFIMGTGEFTGDELNILTSMHSGDIMVYFGRPEIKEEYVGLKKKIIALNQKYIDTRNSRYFNLDFKRRDISKTPIVYSARKILLSQHAFKNALVSVSGAPLELKAEAENTAKMILRKLRIIDYKPLENLIVDNYLKHCRELKVDDAKKVYENGGEHIHNLYDLYFRFFNYFENYLLDNYDPGKITEPLGHFTIIRQDPKSGNTTEDKIPDLHPLSFKAIFVDPAKINPCLELLLQTESPSGKPIVDYTGKYIGGDDNKSVMHMWLLKLQKNALIKGYDNLRQQDVINILNYNFPELQISLSTVKKISKRAERWGQLFESQMFSIAFGENNSGI